jgi:hypothetical protein
MISDNSWLRKPICGANRTLCSELAFAPKAPPLQESGRPRPQQRSTNGGTRFLPGAQARSYIVVAGDSHSPLTPLDFKPAPEHFYAIRLKLGINSQFVGYV